MKLSVITPVRNRPKGFALCRRWMKSQRRRADEWIVVDDGEIPCASDRVLDEIRKEQPGFKYVRREYVPDISSYPENIAEGARHVTGERFAIIEDDDWRGPGYLEELENHLGRSKAGVAFMWEYNVYHLPQGYFARHATAIQGPRDPHDGQDVDPGAFRAKRANLHIMADTEPYLDYLVKSTERSILKTWSGGTKRSVDVMTWFWVRVQEEGHLVRLVFFNKQLLGIKGLPGDGITGVHHDANRLDPRPGIDSDRSTLVSFVGREDAEAFLNTMGESLNAHRE